MIRPKPNAGPTDASTQMPATSRLAWCGPLFRFAQSCTEGYPRDVRRRLTIVNVMACMIAVFSLIYAGVFTAFGVDEYWPLIVDLRVRVGLAGGPVMAGVIGTDKFSYDVWGETVNLASRLESHGLPGEIQVTAEVREALGDGFVFEPRGPIEVKGVGILETWLLKKERGASQGVAL
jgi:class 3 adenylate cyclase